MILATPDGEALGGAEAWVLIVIALIGLAGVVIPSLFAYRASVHARTASQQATEANLAVNGNPAGTTRLYDLALGTMEKVDAHHDANMAQHATIADTLARHEHSLDTIDRIESLTHPAEYRSVLMDRPYWPGHPDRRNPRAKNAGSGEIPAGDPPDP